jgi:hypothetical protein
MVLIQEYEERILFEDIVRSYEAVHENLSFERVEETLDKEKLGEVYYTFPGEESRVTFAKKVVEIKKAIEHGYSCPFIIMRKSGKDILIDGHRRARAAWDLGIPWKALVMIPNRDVEFGIEKYILGKIKDMW